MICSVRSIVLLAMSSLALVAPVAADGSRMRRPRGARPVDPPRERGDRRDRRERRERPVDAPRLREGVYGDEAGSYGDEAGAYGDGMMGMDVDMTCTTTLLDAVAATPDLATLGTAVAAAGLEGALSDASAELTVLAPTNDAFGAIDPDTLTDLLGKPEELGQILTLHVIEGAVFASDLTDGMVVPTLNGGDLTVSVSDAGITFTSEGGVVSTVVMPDIDVCSSVVHVIDSVLLP